MSVHRDGCPETWDGNAAVYEELRLRAEAMAQTHEKAGVRSRTAWWRRMAGSWRRRRDDEQRCMDEAALVRAAHAAAPLGHLRQEEIEALGDADPLDIPESWEARHGVM